MKKRTEHISSNTKTTIGKALSLILIITLAVMMTSCSTTEELPPGKSELSFILEATNKSKDELFVAANSWAVDAFRSAESVIEFSDKEAGIIKGNFTTEAGTLWSSATMKCTITIECREGRVRILFTDPMQKDVQFGGLPISSSFWEDAEGNFLSELNLLWEAMASSLEEAINSTPEEW